MGSFMNFIMKCDARFRQTMEKFTDVGPLALRLLLAWEYWEAGSTKLNGTNWFQHIQEKFPFPFSVIDPDISWFLATWFEILGAIALLIGLGTRYASLSLIVLTTIAAIAVHIPPEGWSSASDMLSGYAISDEGEGNYKLPLIYIVMFIPRLVMGHGRLSIDFLIARGNK